jgi:hypothetical protein
MQVVPAKAHPHKPRDVQQVAWRAAHVGHVGALHLQAPLWHVCPVAHANSGPQPPQLLLSVFSSTHAPLQRENPLWQVKPHAPRAQVAVALATPVEHAWPQPAQLPTLVVVSTHDPLQRVYPLLHAKVHARPTHVGAALGTLVEQAVVHVPQWLALLARSTQLPLHGVGVAAGQPDRHVYPPAFAPASPAGPHTGVLPEQALPQAPQLSAVVYRVHAPPQRP